MTKIIGIRFRDSGKVYYFDPQDHHLRNGDRVIVETARGQECASVVLSVREVADEKIEQPLRPVVRIATESDLQRDAENREKEKEALVICREKIREHGLDMKLIKAEYSFDNKRVLFYFTADGRVDFRGLVKDLASVFRTRIELRQVGVRDEARLLGGIGTCGRPLCCSTFLADFSSVSIKMAKEQNLSLNPTKISGACGRLMCCLKNEQETYEHLNKNMPGLGDVVAIHIEGEEETRTGEVHSVDVLRQRARVIIEVGDNKEIEEYPAEQLEVVMTRRKKNKERAKERERLQKEKKEQREKEKSLARERGDKEKAETREHRKPEKDVSGERRKPEKNAAGEREAEKDAAKEPRRERRNQRRRHRGNKESGLHEGARRQEPSASGGGPQEDPPAGSGE